MDDADLDSGDELDRNDRMDEDEPTEEPFEEREVAVTDIELARHGIPKGSDGEVRWL